MELQDEQLAAAFRQGDKKAFEALFRENYEPLCRFAYSFVNDRDEAEDVVQNLFVSFWEKKDDHEIESNLKGYLYRMTRNACLNVLKHKKVVERHAEGSVLSEWSHSEAASDLTIANELEGRIQHAIQSLPEQCRVVFELSRFENLKYAEIAARLKISEKTVENQIGKALRVMREQLKEYLMLVIIVLLLK